MTDVDASRRLFLQQGAALAGSRWAALVLPSLTTLSSAAAEAQERAAAFTVLTDEEAIELEAIAARIMPTTDTPGAREAGVIYFFDQTFNTLNAPMLQPLRGMLPQFLNGIDGERSFSALSEPEQDEYLRSQEQTPLFGMVRFLTLCGMFGMSKYGGNRDNIGWELVDFDANVHVHQSPFGYYDAGYLRDKSDA